MKTITHIPESSAALPTTLGASSPPRSTRPRQWPVLCPTWLLPLLLLALPAAVEAQYTYTTNADGTIAIAGYTGCGSVVTVPNRIDGRPVTAIGDFAFVAKPELTSVSIPGNVTHIGSGVFSLCTGLTNITVDPLNPAYASLEGVLFDKSRTTLMTYPGGKGGAYLVPESVRTIGDFDGSTELTSVTIPDGVTSIGGGAFGGCAGLTNVTIGRGVINIGWQAFGNCISLTSVTIPEGVASIGDGAFDRCAGLTNITVDPLSPAYSSLDGVLFDKNQDTLITCPAGRGGAYTVPDGVMRIEGFTGCTRLTSVTIPDTVSSIAGGAFEGCTGLTSVVIPNGMSKIENDTFFGCAGLKSVTIPNSVTDIGDLAFQGCSGLTNVTIPESVTAIGKYPFVGCTALTNLDVDPLNPAYSSLDGVLFDSSQETLITCPGGKGGDYVMPDSVSGIANWAFSDCSGLTSLTIPGSVTHIGLNAFIGCTGLTNISVDPLSPFYSSLDGVLFDTSLETVLTYPAGRAGGYVVPNTVSAIAGNAFYGCAGLTSLTIPQSVVEIVTFGYKVWTFRDCTSLTNISVDPLNTNYSSGDGVLFGKNQDILVTYPGGKGGRYAVPDGVASIEAGAFAFCNVLTNVTVGNNVTSIGRWAFFGCSGLSKVTIGNRVSSLGGVPFYDCNGLTSAYFIGNAPTLDGSDVFQGATNLTVYHLPATTGWCSTFSGRPAVLWNPQVQVGDGGFGVQANGFGFNIAGTPDIPLVVEASTNLATDLWVPLQSLTLTNGLVSFRDPAWTNYSTRFYRLRSP